MNKLHIGSKRVIIFPKGGHLYIDDEYPELGDWKRPKRFDPFKHSFNPLNNLDYLKASAFVAAMLDAFPSGNTTTLTKEGVPDAFFDALNNEPARLDQLFPFQSKDPSYISAQRMVRRILRSPVLKHVLCNTNPRNEFVFDPNSVVLARLNRAELSDFDALVLGLLLIAQFDGQIVIPDFGFYGRDAHISLIRQHRLIVGVNFLDELPLQLRNAVLLIDDKVGEGALFDDAEILARYAGYIPGQEGHTTFVQQTMGLIRPAAEEP